MSGRFSALGEAVFDSYVINSDLEDLRMNSFGPALMISGAIILSACIIANSGAIGCLGIALLLWGCIDSLYFRKKHLGNEK